MTSFILRGTREMVPYPHPILTFADWLMFGGSLAGMRVGIAMMGDTDWQGMTGFLTALGAFAVSMYGLIAKFNETRNETGKLREQNGRQQGEIDRLHEEIRLLKTGQAQIKCDLAAKGETVNVNVTNTPEHPIPVVEEPS